MGQFDDEKQLLRQNPVYVRACQTGPVMHDWPPGQATWKRDRHMVDDWKLKHAGRRLDWLFRRALYCDNRWGALDPQAICAIEDFIRYIESQMPTMHLITSAGRAEIDPRLVFGKLLLDLDRRERATNRWDKNHDTHWFENFVQQNSYTMQQIVFENPFRILYHSPGGYSGVGSTGIVLNHFHNLMKHFWE